MDDKSGYNFVGVIPARYHSTRFPGKVLEPIDGLPMVVKVYNQVLKSRLKNNSKQKDKKQNAILMTF